MVTIRQAIAATLLLCAGLPELALAQDERRCLPPTHTLETLKEFLLDPSTSENTASRVVSSAIAPGRCPVMQEGTDLQAVAEEVIGWAVELGEERRFLQRSIFDGISRGLRLKESPPPTFAIIDDRWAPPEENYHLYQPPEVTLPFDALADAVERGPTRGGRWEALKTLFDFERQPRVFAYLLRWARAPQGPAAFHDLPERIVGSLTVYEGQPVSDSPLRRALQADPSQIANPKARCQIERGPIPFPTERGPLAPTPEWHC